jgi:hypothetical protein
MAFLEAFVNDDVHYSVKCKVDFDKLKSISKWRTI